jgi:hypothetical protein
MATHQGKRYNLNAPAVESATAARAIPVDRDDTNRMLGTANAR